MLLILFYFSKHKGKKSPLILSQYIAVFIYYFSINIIGIIQVGVLYMFIKGLKFLVLCIFGIYVYAFI